jgi:hypothetical protein
MSLAFWIPSSKGSDMFCIFTSSSLLWGDKDFRSWGGSSLCINTPAMPSRPQISFQLASWCQSKCNLTTGLVDLLRVYFVLRLYISWEWFSFYWMNNSPLLEHNDIDQYPNGLPHQLMSYIVMCNVFMLASCKASRYRIICRSCTCRIDFDAYNWWATVCLGNTYWLVYNRNLHLRKLFSYCISPWSRRYPFNIVYIE